jgi:bis(5'-nucleosyl)-tetraphosphatase (symmetrical)
MSHFVIGDVQGCYEQLNELLSIIDFSPTKDHIIFAGDMVNRGNDSLKVLDFCLSNPNSVSAVLGNHDLYLMHLIESKGSDNCLQQILECDQLNSIYSWLKSCPLMKSISIDESKEIFHITHAGIPPIWTFDEARKYSNEISNELIHNPKSILSNMWGDYPNLWRNDLKGHERNRLIINYFTRMRFLFSNGALELKTKGLNEAGELIKWFDLTEKNLGANEYILFGHWAALKGKTDLNQIIGLDTGCVWGGDLTAIKLENKKLYSVNNNENL